MKDSSPLALQGVVQIGAGAAVGGATAELMDGDFATGAEFGAIGGAIGFGVSRIAPELWAYLKGILTDREGVEAEFGVDESQKGGAVYKPPEFDFEGVRQRHYTEYGPGLEWWRQFDLTGNGFKFGTLHVRPEGFHYDWIDIVKHPLPHLVVDTISGPARALIVPGSPWK